MEDQEIQVSQGVINNELSKKAISEYDLGLTLNVSRSTLDSLRLEKGFPFVRLSLKSRVYLVDSIIEWLKSHEVS